MLSQSSRAYARNLSSPSSSRLAVGQIHQRVSHKYHRVNRPAIALNNSNSIVRAPPAKADDTIRQKQGVGYSPKHPEEKLFDGFIVTEEFAKSGMRVERGMDWKWGDQVGG